MKRFQALLGCAIVMLFVPNLVFGQQAAGGQQAQQYPPRPAQRTVYPPGPAQRTVVEKKDFSLSIGGRAWYSMGNSHSTDGSPTTGARIDELTWDNVDSIVAEFTADMLFLDEYILTIDGGFGAISDGTLVDLDWAPIVNAEDLISESISVADDDDMWFASIMLGARVLNWNVRDEKPRSYLALMIGYQHWTETYVATKAVQKEDPFGFVGFLGPFPDQGKAITQTFTWDSLLVGVRTEIEILPDFTFKGRFMAVPFTHFTLEDIHHQRTDLKQDPSFKSTADGGIGVILDATLSYNFWGGFSIEGGYQFWDISSAEGTTTAFGLTGSAEIPLLDAHSTRHGAIAGISYRF